MPTAFHALRDNVASSVAAARPAGGATLALDPGTGTSFGTVFPMLVSIFRGDVPITILEATGRSGDTLAISGPAADSTDADALAGDTVLNANCTAYIEEIQGAVNGVETALAGKAATIHVHSGADITTGTVGPARLGTGTADGTTYLRGDGAWIVPPTGGGGAGTVTSVALSAPSQFAVGGSPVVGSGTLALTWVNAAANTLLAGPTSGGGAAPTFRSLTPTDFGNQAQSTVLAGPIVGGAQPPTFRKLNADDFANQSANTVAAGPTSGAAVAPTFRSLVAADIPALDTSKITTGVFAVARLGTGTPSGSNYLRGDGTWQAVTATPGGSTGQLQWNNAGALAGTTQLVYATSGSNLTITASGNFDIALVLKRATGTQSSALTSWQDEFGNPLSSVSAAGVFAGNGSGLTAINGGNISTGTINAARLGAAGSTGQIQWNNAGAMAGAALATYATSVEVFTVAAGAAADKVLILVGAANQTGNLFEGRSSMGSAMFAVTAGGWFYMFGAHCNFLPPGTPAPTVSTVGTAGSTTYSYKVAAMNAVGDAVPGAAATTASGNATLSVSNYNLISWPHVNGAQYYKVYGRTAGTEKYLTTVITNSYADTGAASPTTAVPTTTPGGTIGIKSWVGQTNDLMQWLNSAGTVVSSVDSGGYHLMARGSGAPATAPADGAIYIDTAAARIYVRCAGVWKSAALT